MTNLKEDEKIALLNWTSPTKDKLYRDIKKVAQNKYLNSSHSINENGTKWFASIENLFLNQEDNTSSYDTIYRADIIENHNKDILTDAQLFYEFCNNHKIGQTFSMNDIICSFSTKIEISKKLAELNDKFDQETKTTPIVMCILKKRVSKYLYIAPYASKSVRREEEVLTLGIKKFNILDVKKYDTNYVEIYLEEIVER